LVVSFRRPTRLCAPAAARAAGSQSPRRPAKQQSIRPTQALLLVKLFKRLKQFRQIARDDRVESIQVQIDAVIGDAVLREIVGANSLAAVAGADQAPPLLGPFLVQLLLLHLEDAGPQDSQRPLVILVLAPL